MVNGLVLICLAGAFANPVLLLQFIILLSILEQRQDFYNVISRIYYVLYTIVYCMFYGWVGGWETRHTNVGLVWLSVWSSITTSLYIFSRTSAITTSLCIFTTRTSVFTQDFVREVRNAGGCWSDRACTVAGVQNTYTHVYIAHF